jgi:hypothetical protein
MPEGNHILLESAAFLRYDFRMKLKYFGYFFGILFILLIASPFLIDKFVMKKLVEDFKKEHVISKEQSHYLLLDKYKGDLEILKPKLAFLKGKKSADAGPFLNPKVDWGMSQENQKELQSQFDKKFGTHPKIVVDENTKTLLRNSQANIFELDPELFSKIDTSWMREIRKFDHWDIDKNSPLDFMPRYFVTTPMPTMSTEFSKIHLLKAKNKPEAEYLEALLDVLHFGGLCASTETLIGEMVFVSILGTVKTFLEKRPLISEGLGDWSSVIEEGPRIKKVAWATNHFANPIIGANASQLKEVFLAHSTDLGLCAAIREATSLDYTLWSTMRDGQPELLSEYPKIVTENSSLCRLSWIKEKAPPWVQLPGEADSIYRAPDAASTIRLFWVNCPDSKLFNQMFSVIHYLPHTREYIGLTLQHIAVPNFLKFYQEEEKK